MHIVYFSKTMLNYNMEIVMVLTGLGAQLEHVLMPWACNCSRTLRVCGHETNWKHMYLYGCVL